VTLEHGLRRTITPRGVWLAWQAHELRQRNRGARIARWLAKWWDLILGQNPRPN
jgi:hypothetical protein